MWQVKVTRDWQITHTLKRSLEVIDSRGRRILLNKRLCPLHSKEKEDEKIWLSGALARKREKLSLDGRVVCQWKYFVRGYEGREASSSVREE